MKNKTFDFHGSKFTIKVLTSESSGMYTILDILHAPNLGPGLHTHPRGPETFYIVEGDYEFFLGTKSIMAKAGDVIVVPKGAPHRLLQEKMAVMLLLSVLPNLNFIFGK